MMSAPTSSSTSPAWLAPTPRALEARTRAKPRGFRPRRSRLKGGVAAEGHDGDHVTDHLMSAQGWRRVFSRRRLRGQSQGRSSEHDEDEG